MLTGEVLRARARRRAQGSELLVRAPLLPGEDPTGARLVVLEGPRPDAWWLPGAAPQLVITTAALGRLKGSQLDAVLAHEQGHAAARHDWLLNCSRALARGFPQVPVFAAFEAEMHRLVEMAADDVASRRFGRLTIALALVGLNEDRGCSRPPRPSTHTFRSGCAGCCRRRPGSPRPPAAADGAGHAGSGDPAAGGLRTGAERPGVSRPPRVLPWAASAADPVPGRGRLRGRPGTAPARHPYGRRLEREDDRTAVPSPPARLRTGRVRAGTRRSGARRRFNSAGERPTSRGWRSTGRTPGAARGRRPGDGARISVCGTITFGGWASAAPCSQCS